MTEWHKYPETKPEHYGQYLVYLKNGNTAVDYWDYDYDRTTWLYYGENVEAWGEFTDYGTEADSKDSLTT